MVKTLVYGIYPRSARLRRSYNRWERGLINIEELSDIIREEKEIYYNHMEESGIHQYTDPLFNWYDILRPVILSMKNVRLGPLTRYLETNTFYRMPEFEGIPEIVKNIGEFQELEENPPLPLYQLDRRSSIFLPSPYTVIKMSSFTDSINQKDILNALIREYIKIAKAYERKEIVLFDSFPYNDNNISYLDPLLENNDVTLVTAGNPGEKNFKGLKNKFATVVLGKEDKNILKFSRNLGAKAVDSHRTKIEGISSKDYEWAGVLTHGDYMDFLPREIADIKVGVLGKAGERQ